MFEITSIIAAIGIFNIALLFVAAFAVLRRFIAMHYMRLHTRRAFQVVIIERHLKEKIDRFVSEGDESLKRQIYAEILASYMHNEYRFKYELADVTDKGRGLCIQKIDNDKIRNNWSSFFESFDGIIDSKVLVDKNHLIKMLIKPIIRREIINSNTRFCS